MGMENITGHQMNGRRVIAERLADVSLFENLHADLQIAIAAHCHLTRYREGEVLVRQGAHREHVLFVISGRLRAVIYTSDGKEVAFEEHGPGNCAGEYTAIDGGPALKTVFALEETSVVAVPVSTFSQIVRTHPGVGLRVSRSLSQVIRKMSERICEFTTMGVNERVRSELLRLVNENNPADANHHADAVIIKYFPTHAEFANRISTHREAVTREINSLERGGIVERKDGEFIVIDVQGLKRLVAQVSSPTLH